MAQQQQHSPSALALKKLNAIRQKKLQQKKSTHNTMSSKKKRGSSSHKSDEYDDTSDDDDEFNVQNELFTTGGGNDLFNKSSKEKSGKSKKPGFKAKKKHAGDSTNDTLVTKDDADTSDLREQTNFIVIRNDGGMSDVYRQYRVGKTASAEVVLPQLSSTRYVNPNSAILLAQTSSKSSEPVEIDISLDGPMFRPNEQSEISYIGKKVSVYDASEVVWIGIVVALLNDHFVDLYLQKSKQNVRIRYNRIEVIEPNTIDPSWNSKMQEVVVVLPPQIETLFLHYQTRPGLFEWKPSYRAVIHPNFQFLTTLKCVATVSNNTLEDLNINKLRLRVMKLNRQFNQRRYSVRKSMVSSAMPLMAMNESVSPKTSVDASTILAEFIAPLPGKMLPAQKSCTLQLFNLYRVPISTWYELTMDATSETSDIAHLPILSPKWFLQIENSFSRDIEASVVSKQSKIEANPNVNWPSGNIQVLLLGTTESSTVAPDKVTWLQDTDMKETPTGQHVIMELPSPWNVSAKYRVEITKSPSSDVTMYACQSNMNIEISNNDLSNSTRFPIRLRFHATGIARENSDLKLSATPVWTTTEKNIFPDIPFSGSREGQYWILVFTKPLPPQFKRILNVKFIWTEAKPIRYKPISYDRNGGNANLNVDIDAEVDVDAEVEEMRQQIYEEPDE